MFLVLIFIVFPSRVHSGGAPPIKISIEEVLHFFLMFNITRILLYLDHNDAFFLEVREWVPLVPVLGAAESR